MNAEERKELYSTQTRDMYWEASRLRRLAKDPDQRAQVEQYAALSEEAIACGYDADRCERELQFCDTETERGSAAHAEYTRMVMHARTRLKTIMPKIEKLKKELKAREELKKERR
jgi:hypothetical protein